MKAQGWRRFGLYAWDKLESVPGDHNGRLAPSLELIFHFNKNTRYPNKIKPCKRIGAIFDRAGVQRAANGGMDGRKGQRVVSSHKIDDCVLRLHPEKNNRTGHPAVFPASLPLSIHASYTNAGELVYDPFSGSGTSILAAEQGGRVCYAMEIEPSYCDVAADRWRARKPTRPPLAV